MKLKPIEDHVVVELSADAEEKKVGGIIIPDTAKEKPQMAKVVAVGTDDDLKKIVKVGDTVLFGKYSGTEIELDSKKYLILGKKEILAIVV
jgi:chaperonin GroES